MSDIDLIDEALSVANNTIATYDITPEEAIKRLQDNRTMRLFSVNDLSDDPLMAIKKLVGYPDFLVERGEKQVLCDLSAIILNVVNVYKMLEEGEDPLVHIWVGAHIGDTLRKLMFAIEYPEYRKNFLKTVHSKKSLHALQELVLDYTEDKSDPRPNKLLEYLEALIGHGVISSIDEIYIHWIDHNNNIKKIE